MYRILFIDEESDAFNAFRDYFEESSLNDQIAVLTEFPLSNLNDMIELIIKLNPDAVISDFMLNEMKTEIKYNVPYSGVELLKEFLEVREGFPCFILTSFDDDAIHTSDDVNIVYVKGILQGEEVERNVKASFVDRVISQINHYRYRIFEAEKELIRLIDLRNSGEVLTVQDENEIIRLDHFLECSIDKRNSIPEDLKKVTNSIKFEALISKVDELIDKFKSKDGK